MMTYAEIRDRAIARKGEEAYRAGLPEAPARPLSELGDDRLLAEFTKRIFQAGFNWQVIETKWPGFEEAFWGFDIARCAMMSEDDLDLLLSNAAIVRNGPKILAVRDNAVFLSELAQEHGSATAHIGAWPGTDQVGLLQMLKARGARLGGMTGQYALRFAGYDNFILSRSVVAALNMAGVIEGAANSKTALTKVQQAFNDWAAESGERYAVISRTLAMSVPD